MALWLQQSTASQEIPLGYFVSSTDGNTAQTALTIANTDINLWKTGATSLVSKNSGGATHMAGGVYYCTLDATDTNTLGPMVIFVHVSGALPVRVECEIVTPAAYTVLTAVTGDAYARLGAPAGASVSADIASVQSDTNDIQTRLPAALVSGRMDSSVGAMASNTLTAAALATDAVTEISGGVWDLTRTGHSTVGTFGEGVASVIGNVGGNVVGSVASVVGAVGSVTGNVGGNVTGSVGSVVGAVGSVTGNVGGNVTGSVGSVAGAVGSVTGNVGGDVVGSVASVAGAVGSVTGDVGGNVVGSIGSLGATAQSDVKDQIVAALDTDTYAESSAVPAATATLVAKIGWLATLARNKLTQTSTTQTLFADDGSTLVADATVSDDGTTLTRGKFV